MERSPAAFCCQAPLVPDCLFFSGVGFVYLAAALTLDYNRAVPASMLDCHRPAVRRAVGVIAVSMAPPPITVTVVAAIADADVHAWGVKRNALRKGRCREGHTSQSQQSD